MNGFASSTPSQSAIRLLVSGFLLLLVHLAIVLLADGVAGERLRAVGLMLGAVSFTAFAAALWGGSGRPALPWWRRRP